MARILSLILLITALLSVFPAFSEEAGELEKIVVTPSRLKTLSDTGRSVTDLDAETIKMSGYDALQDIIGNLSGVDIRRRGREGVQSDVNIRGATFEQNTVLLDGIKLNDPQTGHHTMDLPVTIFDAENVEIMKGPASSLYGANSFGGVINILTRIPKDKELIVEAVGGEQDYFSGGVAVSYPIEFAKNRFAIDWRRASAYKPDTEFDIIDLSDKAVFDTPFGVYDFFFGYSFKHFGADSFYSNVYPREEEITDTRFFKLGGKLEFGALRIEPKIYLRRHFDKFMLDKTRPGWQTNYHTTYTYGTDTQFIVESRFMDVAYGIELAQDTIFSTNLQKHYRGRTGVYLEILPRIHEKLYLNAGIRQDTYSDFDIEYSPSVNLRYSISGPLSIRGSAGRSYRIPTFTDLYYRDVANIGNDNLTPESSWTYEAGIDYKSKLLNISAGYFRRNAEQTIDWVRNNSNDPWRASNIGSVKTNGAEACLEIMPQEAVKSFPVKKFFMRYTALDMYNKHDYLSKYALDYLKQQISSGVEIDFLGFNNSWVLNYKKRVGDQSSSVVVDTKFVKNIINNKGVVFDAFLEITNLFDADYSEQSGVPMPGKQIKSGMRLGF